MGGSNIAGINFTGLFPQRGTPYDPGWLQNAMDNVQNQRTLQQQEQQRQQATALYNSPDATRVRGETTHWQGIEDLARSERNRVSDTYGGLRSHLETAFNRRGIGRSGFAPEAMTRLGSEEGMAYQDVDQHTVARKQEYQAQLDQEAAQRAQEAAEARRRSRGWLGTLLGVFGAVLAPFTGGASLAALPVAALI